MHYLLYTDGAYYPDHERSAISYVMINAKTKREERRLSQTVKGETSGRAEIKAIISAVYALPSDADSCTIISDSRYALDACSRKAIRYHNGDLFVLFDKIVEARGLSVTYQWVRAHNGNFYNELCDALCKQAIDEYISNKNKNESV